MGEKLDVLGGDYLTPDGGGVRDYIHVMELAGVYADRQDGSVRFHRGDSPTNQELARLTQTIARRVGRYLERQGLLERDAENSYLAPEAVPEDPMAQLLGHSITYRIAVGSQAGRKVYTLQTLPGSEPVEFVDTAAPGYPVSPCTLACRPGRMNARNWSVCVDTSAGRRYRKGACR